MSAVVKSTRKDGASTPLTALEAGIPNDAAAYMASLEDMEIVEHVRCCIATCHVFSLPVKKTAGGWRGGDWTNKVWQGSLKVVDRGELTVVLLTDKQNGSIFAVCPINKKKNGAAVDRCVDSSRYFVLRLQDPAKANRHVFIGVAFEERGDAFDFNVALEDSARDREKESKLAKKKNNNLKPPSSATTKDIYRMKEGEKIHVSPKGHNSSSKIIKKPTRLLSKAFHLGSREIDTNNNNKVSALAPSARDTPAMHKSKPEPQKLDNAAFQQDNVFEANFEEEMENQKPETVGKSNRIVSTLCCFAL